MNHLTAVGEGCWELPRHAHVVAYENGDRALLTVYHCGAAQAPPAAQVIGRIVRVSADHEQTHTPTGYTVGLREPAVLERQADREWLIRSRKE
jgi:hypothetical protein